MTGKRQFLAFLTVLIFSVGVFAQKNSINGTIADAAGKPIAGASVVLRNKKTGLERVVTTNDEGKFTFNGIADGEFEVVAAAKGFGRVVRDASASGEVSLTLEPAAITEQVTVVSGSRQEELRESLTTKVDVLTANDLKTTGYETVGEALREVPGVITRRGSETTPVTGEQVQGIDSRQVLVLLDGQPLSGARGVKSGIVNLDRQQVGQLDSVEVVKGAASALYGSDAIGGVINLRTKDQTEPFSASANIAAGNFGVFDGKGTLGFVQNKLSGIFNFGRHKNNGFDLFPRDFTTDGSGYHRYDGYAKLKYQFTDNFSVIGFGNGYWNNARGRVVAEPSPGNTNGQQIIDVDDDSQNYGATADWAIDGKTNLQVRGYLSRYDEIYHSRTPTGTQLPDGNLFERYGKFDLTFSRVIGERHFLQAGAEFATNRYSGLFRLQNDRGEADTQVVWLQDKINVTRRLTFTVGARLDHHSEFGTAGSPKIGVNYKLTDYASLRASWGRGFRAPDLGQLFYRFNNALFGYQVIGNPGLSPEHSGSWQVGGEFNGFSRKLRFGVNLFRNDIRNLINSRSLGTVTLANVDALLAANNLDPVIKPFITYNRLLLVYQNLQNVYTQGVEADASYVLPFGFSASGAYTFLDTKDKSPTAVNSYLTFRHKHHGFAKVGYDNPRRGISANFRGTFFGNYWATATRKAPAFQFFDLYGAKKIWKGFELYGTIDNLFNSQDPNTGRANPNNPNAALAIDRADAGRTFRIGIRWEFNKEDW